MNSDQAPQGSKSKNQPSMLKAALVFLLVFVVLELAYNALRDTLVSEVIIDQLTVATSARILDALNQEEQVESKDNRILSPSVKLTVSVGCEGTETLLLLIAAIVALSLPWRHKLLGIVLGSVLVYVLNLIRISGLYFALKYNKGMFDALHSYIAPLLIVIIVGLCFSLWLSFLSRQTHAADSVC